MAGTLLNVRLVLLKCRVSSECIDDNCLCKKKQNTNQFLFFCYSSFYRNCACTSGLLFNNNTCNDVNRRICGGNVSKNL